MASRGSSFAVEHAALIRSSAQLVDAPADNRPELCVVGRSNVGKSSLLNLLLGRSGLARTSRTPGRTRLANFFEARVRGPQRRLLELRLVDLPGYGYAKVSHAERDRLDQLLESYFVREQRPGAALHLIDGRHPLPDNDRHIHQVLRQTVARVVVVATKIDAVGKARRVGVQRHLEQELAGCPVVLTSAREGLGRDAMWRALWPWLMERPDEVAG